MKKHIIGALVLLFSSYTLLANKLKTDSNKTETDTETIIASYDEFDGEVYTFEYLDEDGNEAYILFDFVTLEVLKQFDLKKGDFHGKNFEVTYTIVSKIKPDEDGDLQEDITTTITKLTLIK